MKDVGRGLQRVAGGSGHASFDTSGYPTDYIVAGSRFGTVTRGKRKAVYFYIKY